MKVCLLVLQTYEDQLLSMSFEMMLSQLMNLPGKFLLNEPTEISRKYKDSMDDLETKKLI